MPPVLTQACTTSLADRVRRHDPDRFFTALFAPAERQAALFVLYAFNHELARAHEVAREPLLAMIRLQWWREVVEGEARPHEVASPLSEALGAGALPREPLLAMIASREAEAEPAENLAGLLGRLRQGPGSLAVAAGLVLGAGDDEQDRLRTLGTGVGLVGLMRNVAADARLGRCQLPRDVLQKHALSGEAVIADPRTAMLAPVRRDLVIEAGRLLGRARRIGRPVVAAGLPAVFARRDLSRNPRSEPRGIGDKLAVMVAAALGVV
jgi:phytoene synthase